jgi:hypothetical protein
MMHWKRWRKHGDPLMLAQARPPEDRFWEKVDRDGPDGFHSQTGANLGPCWLWTASQDRYGYGQMKINGRRARPHRFAYELLVGPIPEGLDLDHLCRVRLCVNPYHLEPVTNLENILRGDGIQVRNAAKTHCLSGHAFTPENTYVGRGHRKCQTCQRAWNAAYRARRRAS